MHRLYAGEIEQEDHEALEEAKSGPASRTQEKGITSIAKTLSNFRILSKFKRSIIDKTLKSQEGILGIAAYYTLRSGEEIFKQYNKIFCEDLPPDYSVPIQGCWKDKSKNGASWGLWLNLGLGITALTVFSLRYYFHKPIFDDSTLNAYNIPEDELKEIIVAINHDNQTNISEDPINATTTAKVAFEQTSNTLDRMKITLKDRPGALTFFMRSHHIKKGTVFGSGINKKIAEFLGCLDLPEIALSKLKKRN